MKRRRRRRKARLYYREGRGWYADLRDYAEVGGRQEAMIPAGARGATRNSEEAERILRARLDELDRRRRGLLPPDEADPTLEGYVRRHLEAKALSRRSSTVARDERCLRIIVGYFGSAARLSHVTVGRLTDYVRWRKAQPNGRGGQIAPQTLLHELHALSSLFRRAIAEGVAIANPVAALQKPSVERAEASWLEIGEAARLLKAAAAIDAEKDGRRSGFAAPLLATFLLTGGRVSEVLGLEVRDVDLDHGVVQFRENVWRRLKRAKHRRSVALWPQLRGYLEPHLEGRSPAQLLFPGEGGRPIRDIRKTLGTVLERAEIEKRVTPHTLRHTYTAARLQTLDHGAPVSPYTVMRELGHRSIELIEKTYGHLLNVRHRAEVVEYREAEVVPIVTRVTVRASRGA